MLANQIVVSITSGPWAIFAVFNTSYDVTKAQKLKLSIYCRAYKPLRIVQGLYSPAYSAGLYSPANKAWPV